MYKEQSIAAIATAMSDSGISIIRVSGDDAIFIVDQVFSAKSNKKLIDVESHTIHYGFIKDKREIIDEVMVSVMRAPRSYTTENTVEINCHGGVLITNHILNLVLKKGAKLAEPGEFTKRAFLNGRLDLSKAEAVMDIIHAKNEFALKSSINQLKGSISDIIKECRSHIIYEIAFIESALDDPEHISLDGYNEKLKIVVENELLKLNKLYDTADNGKIIKEGINTVIVGKPNAGKSSLLNILVGEEKAIVTSIAGTTRDVLEENIKLHGIGLNVIDTAGIRNTEDIVEKIGVSKAKKYATDADLLIYVVDASVPFDENDYEIIKLIKDKKNIILLNKTDLKQVVREEDIINKYCEINNMSITESSQNDNCNLYQISQIEKNFGCFNNELYIIKTSTKDNIGINYFEDVLKDLFFNGDISFNDQVYVTNTRHKEAIFDAINSLKMVKESLEMMMPEDFLTIDLMSAYASLGYIIGEEIGENLVNEIFSKFCMGK